VPETETTISSEIPAAIKKINGDLGSYFKKGQLLVSFDCATLEAEKRKAQAELSEANKINQVNQRLGEFKSISDLEIAVSESRLERARAEVKLWEVRLDKCQIKAPFNGRIISRFAHPYEYVEPGQPLLKLLDNVNLNLQIFVPSNWLSHLKTGQKFTVIIDETGKKYSARISRLGAKVDPVSQTIEIRAQIKGNHPELLAGMSGNAAFE
jgi:RND family efflux transporter MFP subunit